MHLCFHLFNDGRQGISWHGIIQKGLWWMMQVQWWLESVEIGTTKNVPQSPSYHLTTVPHSPTYHLTVCRDWSFINYMQQVNKQVGWGLHCTLARLKSIKLHLQKQILLAFPAWLGLSRWIQYMHILSIFNEASSKGTTATSVVTVGLFAKHDFFLYRESCQELRQTF